jgi:hypothetical protein
VIQQSSTADWWKITATVLVTAFVTALLTEPLKLAFTNIHRRRVILKSILMEASRNVTQMQKFLEIDRQKANLGIE